MIGHNADTQRAAEYLFHDWRDAYKLLDHDGTAVTYQSLHELAQAHPALAKRQVSDSLRLAMIAEAGTGTIRPADAPANDWLGVAIRRARRDKPQRAAAQQRYVARRLGWRL